MRSALDAPILDTLHAVQRAPSLLKIAEIFRGFVEEYGYTTFMCADPPRLDTQTGGVILFDTWAPEWRDRYLSRRYSFRDPMVLELCRTVQPFTWDEVCERRRYEPQDWKIVDEASDWGMRSGFVVPILLTGGRVHTVTMAGASPRRDFQARAALHLVSIYAHASALNLRRKHTPPTPLTKRERQVLQLVSDGKSDWEAGTVLGISASAVHKHVENVKRRMGVNTRMQAVVAAIRQGDISV
jgi:LuxR family transcriptional regulator, quorum-sensing system regulator BjaR1